MKRKSIQTKHLSDTLVCLAYALSKRAEDHDHYVSPTLFLMRNTGSPVKVVWAAMERAVDRGYIDYGVAMQSGWLTDEGWALIGQFGLRIGE
ncbi:hypothetical protein ICV35_25005 [Rhodococcus ruber]|uniref:hypothetical protein n=1 Tax=Rhodococcus ruber TaxID=1830 RepID=UPI00177C991D|nr:hypothetical protein [Rhodococcus ruber]MBD8056909.1 hypothetical protein [Rhodococcus ruber]